MCDIAHCYSCPPYIHSPCLTSCSHLICSQPDQDAHTVHHVYANGTLRTLAGIPGSSGYSGENSQALTSLLGGPTVIGAYSGRFLVNCRMTCRILALSPNGTLSTVAGNGACLLAGDGGLATLASINSGWGAIAADPAGPGGGWVFADQVHLTVFFVSHGPFATLLLLHS